MFDLVIEGNAYLNGILNKCCIGIENGKISAIKKILKGERQFDFGDKLILPAGIDVHVHFRDPGLTNKEDFQTGTEAAAFGGISCILDMPNTKPPVISRETLEEKLAIVKEKACIDFGLYSSVISKSNIKNIAEVCSAFKIYLGSTTGKLLYPDDRSLPKTLRDINLASRIPAIHAENEKIINNQLMKLDSAKTLHDHLTNRPNEAEFKAIRRLLNIAKRGMVLKNNARIHICHVSCSESVNSIKRFKNQQKIKPTNPSIKITAEVTPHHLLLNEKYFGGPLGKVNPPLRTSKDQNALWLALSEGTIDLLASDHAPHTYDEKMQKFSEAPAGLPGVETMLPLMLSHLKHNHLSIETLVRAVSNTPAKIFNLPKGEISIGYDGDLIVVDFYKEERIKPKNLHSKCGWTPYENNDAVFPIFSVVRGNVTVKDGNLEADPGWGKFYN